MDKNIITASPANPFDRSYTELYGQFDTEIVQLLSSMGNFTINVTQTPLITKVAVYETEPNAWVMEQLINGSSVMSSATMILTPYMRYSSSYSLAVGYFRPQLFYKARSVREEYNIYYIPFSLDVWVSLFGLLVIITAALTFILGRETKLPHDTPYDLIARIADEQHDDGVDWTEISEMPSKETLKQRETWEMGEILLIGIGALSQQGSARDPSTSAARLLLLFMFLLAALAYTAYSASVISFVSLLPETEKEQRGITKSVPMNKEVALHDTNFFKYSFKSGLIGDVIYTSICQGLDNAIMGNSLFIGDRDASLTHIHRSGYSAEQKCGLARAFLGIQYQRVFALRNDSKLKEVINRNIIKIQELGVLSREKNKVFDIKIPCNLKERSSISGFVSFNINDIKPALILFGSGLLISIILFLLEFCAFSSSAIIKKIFFSLWTKNDKHVQELVSKLLNANSRVKDNLMEEKKIQISNITVDGRIQEPVLFPFTP